MTLIYFNGFEHGNLTDSTYTGDSRSISSVTKRTGGYSLRCSPGANDDGFAQYAGFSSTTGAITGWNAATVYIRFYLYIATLPASGNSLIFRTVGTGGLSKLELHINSDGHLEAWNNTRAAQIGSDGSATLSIETWYCIEVKSPTGLSAAIEVKVDGTSDITGTGNVDDDNNAQIMFGRDYWVGQPAYDLYFDDVSVDDAAYPDVTEILRLDPDGDGTYTAWTRSEGTNDWQMVDEVPPSASDYLLSTKSIGDASTVTLESCANAGVSGTIKGVIAMLFVSRDWLDNLVKFRLRSSTTEVDTATGVQIGATGIACGIFLTQDPATSAAWTTGGVDGVEIGCIEADTVDQVRWYAGYLMVATAPAPSGMGQVI